MKLTLAALATGATLGASLLAPVPAQARFFGGHALEAPSLIDTVQVCSVRTVRTVRGGRVVVNTVRSCQPAARRPVVVAPFFRPPTVVRRSVVVSPNRGCRNVTTRVRTGNRVVVRSVRRCG